MSIDKRLFWFGVAVLLFVLSFAVTQLGVCTERVCGEYLLDVWRGIVMILSMVSAVFSILFGVLRVQDY